MHHSVEARTPFLDYRLVEYTLGLEMDHKISGPWTKRVLREAMSPYLPPSIKERLGQKAFVTPEKIWMKKNSHYFRPLFIEAIALSKGIIRPEAIDMFDEIISGKVPFNFFPWRIICFGQWLKSYNISI